MVLMDLLQVSTKCGHGVSCILTKMIESLIQSEIIKQSPYTEADVPTPALVIDAAVVSRNVSRMADYVKKHGIGLRPHSKTHKSRVFGKMQMLAGAIGLTVAKAGEAEGLASVGQDILMAYPAVDPARCQKLAELARQYTIRVAVDSVNAVEALAAAAVTKQSTIGLLVDVEVGMGRTGVGSASAALALAQKITSTKGVRLDGIMCYPGHIWLPVDQQVQALLAVSEKLQEVIDLWAANGLQAKIVSGGSTPTAYNSHLVKPYTEIRAGTYIFNDLNTLRGGYCAMEDCAARIVCTVVSNAIKDQVVVDGGTKTFTSDLCIPARESGHGYLLEYPQAKLSRLSEEHGQVEMVLSERRPKIGERVTIIPNHICPCVNLQNAVWLKASGALYQINVDTRGMLS